MKPGHVNSKVREPVALKQASSVSLPSTGILAPLPAQKKTVVPAAFSGSAFDRPREFFGSRLVYLVVSARARGLSIGVNMNPDQRCNFNCAYCEVDRQHPSREPFLDVDAMAGDLEKLLKLAHSGELQNAGHYRNIPADLLKLRHVALSGDGEPTLCPNFLDAVRAVVHVRALGRFPFFKIVLITNAAGLHLRDVQDGLKLFTPHDEIWAKLDAGTQDYMDRVNHPDCPLEKILENILAVARQRPVVIQSLFPLLDHEEPSMEEVKQYAMRLYELKAAGAQIPLVQIYSATRPTPHSRCGHLPLKTLADIARVVRAASGLQTEVF